jgi:hypothetical protein
VAVILNKEYKRMPPLLKTLQFKSFYPKTQNTGGIFIWAIPGSKTPTP